MKEQLNELHLFAGAGGGILGGILCGHTTVCAVEIEPYCRKVLLQRQRDGILPEFPIWDDVRTFDGKPWRGKVDIVCGGFPCQDISCAGKGAGIEGERSSMWKHMARIIGEVRPQYAFVENSPMLVGRGLSTVLADLAEMGYDAKWGIVGAHHVSAPHRRDRIWIVATDSNLCRCDDGSYPERQHEANHAQVGEVTEDQQSGSVGQHRISANGCDVADNKCQRLEGFNISKQSNRIREWPPSNAWQNSSQNDVAHSNSAQRQGDKRTERITEEHSDTSRASWWDSEPNVGRVANGVASRVDRLKAIGNGQASSVAALAWRILTNT